MYLRAERQNWPLLRTNRPRCQKDVENGAFGEGVLPTESRPTFTEASQPHSFEAPPVIGRGAQRQ